MSPRALSWIVFDLGETLVDETANWGRWADHLGVPRLTFFAVLGAVVAAGRPHTDVFSYFRAGEDFAGLRAEKAAAGVAWQVTAADLYPDALPTLARLRAQGYRLAVMANQPLEAAPFLATLPVDRCATSAEWGVEKPDPAFFRRIAEEVGAEPSCIAYVGDRVDNDVVPARKAGMVAVHVRRGPWGLLHASWPEASEATLSLTGLAALPDALAGLPAVPS